MVASPGSDNLTGLIVVFVLYMALLVCAGLVGWRKQRKRMQKAQALENAEEELATQFLAGRSLGPFVTMYDDYACIELLGVYRCWDPE
jgi:Na+/melibiose symporter-like transporter